MNNAPAYSNLVAGQDWETVRRILSEAQSSGCSGPVSVCEDALHFTCRFHPPLDVVRMTSSVVPGSIALADNMGRYPLHVATKWGASAPVIVYLAEANPEAAGKQDAMGKTPLHLFCESYARRYSVHAAEGQPLKDSMLEAVKSLCRASPDSVNLEDMDDMTALEYAIDAELNRKVIRVIQKACEKDWKMRRTPGTNHEAVERSLLEQSQQQSARLRKDLLDMTNTVMHASLTSLGESKSLDVPTMDRSMLLSRRPRPTKHHSARAFAA